MPSKSTKPKNPRTIKFAIDGVVSVGDLKAMVDNFEALLGVLTSEVDPDAEIVWVVTDLRGGSAMLEAVGQADTTASRNAVKKVASRYRFVARNAHRKRLENLTPKERECVAGLTSMLNGRVPTARMGTGEHEYIIDQPVPLAQPGRLGLAGQRGSTRTSMKGLIVTLDEKRGTYFTLRLAFTNQLVRCYPPSTLRPLLADFWRDKTWVLVEGTFHRITDLPTLNEITDIVPLGSSEPGTWRQAFGLAPRDPKGMVDSASDVVRKLRDAQ